MAGMELIQVFTVRTPWGMVAAAGSGGVLHRMLLGQASVAAAMQKIRQQFDLPVEQSVWHQELADLLAAYAAGDEPDFSAIKIEEGHLTPFQRKVVQACRRIPRGQTLSYGELAAKAGSPGAARAVGSVMANNRYPLVVPCHRVVASGGRIGGFSAERGISLKRELLALEGVAVG